jgi:glycosyltransferase involved in cell wall biosynthesis
MFRSSLLDDLIFGQPLNVPVRIERWRALRDRTPVRPGSVAVIVVNYNTKNVTATTLEAVRRLSPPDTQIVVIDNASTDGSRAWLRSLSGEIEVIQLPTNMGHGRALDIGVLRTHTEVVITLDSDAFPVRSDWVQRLTEPLDPPTVLAVGWKGRRDRLHPCCAAYSRRALLELGLSFTNFALRPGTPNPVFGVDCWDTGELISEALGHDRVRLIEATDSEFGGMMLGDILYHHCGVTTLITETDDLRKETNHEEGWRRAVKHYLVEDNQAQ